MIPPRKLFGCLALFGLAFLAIGIYGWVQASRKHDEARALVAAGKLEAGAALLRELTESAPRSRRPGIAHELAAVELALGRVDAAEAAVRQGLTMDPGYRPSPEAEAKLRAGIPTLARLRFDASVGLGPWEGLGRPSGEGPSERSWTLVVAAPEPGKAAGTSATGSLVEQFARAHAEAYPGKPELEIDVLVRYRPDEPRRLAYLGRYLRSGLSEPPTLRFTAAPEVMDEAQQPERDRTLIRRLGLEPLAYYWLTVRTHRGGAPQVAALIAAMQEVDSKVFHRFLEWDGFLVRKPDGDGPDRILFPLGPVQALPDEVLRAGVRRFEKGLLAGLTDGWSRELAGGFRKAAEARGLKVE